MTYIAAAYSGLNGVDGLAGWRWLFIIDGVISVGIIIPQLIVVPDVPSRLKPNWMFSERDIELARDRQPKEGRVKQGKFTRVQMKRWFTTPEIWILWLIAVCNNIGYQPSNSMSYWFKAWNTTKPGSYTVPQINNYITPMYAITIAITLSMAWSSDTILKGRRWPMLILGASVNFVVCVLLAATPVFPSNRAFRWFLYYQTGWGEASNCMFWAWTQELLAGDPGTRAFASAGLTVWPGVAAATIPLAVFQTVQQPGVIKGNWTAAGFHVLQVIATLILAYLVSSRRVKDEKVNVSVLGSGGDSVDTESGRESTSETDGFGGKKTPAVTAETQIA